MQRRQLLPSMLVPNVLPASMLAICNCDRCLRQPLPRAYATHPSLSPVLSPHFRQSACFWARVLQGPRFLLFLHTFCDRLPPVAGWEGRGTNVGDRAGLLLVDAVVFRPSAAPEDDLERLDGRSLLLSVILRNSSGSGVAHHPKPQCQSDA